MHKWIPFFTYIIWVLGRPWTTYPLGNVSAGPVCIKGWGWFADNFWLSQYLDERGTGGGGVACRWGWARPHFSEQRITVLNLVPFFMMGVINTSLYIVTFSLCCVWAGIGLCLSAQAYPAAAAEMSASHWVWQNSWDAWLGWGHHPRG